MFTWIYNGTPYDDTAKAPGDGTNNWTFDPNFPGNWHAVYHGNGGDDYFTGYFATNFLEGGADNDTLVGNTGSDELRGGSGDDELHGQGSNDRLNGGEGADILDGGGGVDEARYDDSGAAVTVNLATGIGFGGTAQGDTLTDVEQVYGSVHGDSLTGDDEQNDLFGGGGNDTLHGGGEHDDLNGDAGNDTLYGDAGTDMLLGGTGHDTLKGGGGADILSGESGTDTASYIASLQGVGISLEGNGVAVGGDAEGDTLLSIENLTGSAYRDQFWGDGNANVLRGMNGNDTLKGAGGTDTLWGGTGHDDLYGHDGIDTLRGEAGNDILDGGVGADTMIGGLDNDIYIVDYTYDDVIESAGQGVDEVRISTSYHLPAGADVEILRTTNDAGVAAINLVGNSSGNQIIGNDGDNVIDGGGGVDQMSGRNGDDLYGVDDAGDSVYESGGQGDDTVWASISWTLTEGADVETLQVAWPGGNASISLTGNSSGNVVRGNVGTNVLNGGNGNDELIGLAGQDYFAFTTTLNAATNVDFLSDFNVVDDTIYLDDAVFAAFANGPLAAERFVVGAVAQDASDNIIYNNATGAVLYDSDGNGAAAAIQFATVNLGVALTHLDFLVV